MQSPDSEIGHWVFGAYIVYAANVQLARRIYEVACNRPDQTVLSGAAALNDGSGNWVYILSSSDHLK
jgi:hypothetical protein